jgi:hypothetical protein
MKSFEQVTEEVTHSVTRSVKQNAMVMRSGYGPGFWTLAFGLTLAISFTFYSGFNRARPVVERIPASEVVDITK